MDFFTAIKTCFRKYADFTGRATRSEFWWFVLFLFLADIVLLAILHILWLIFTVGVLLPRIAVAVRRLHDIDRSGWWILLALIPLVGAIVLIIWYCTKGTAGANRFGPDRLAAVGG